MRGVRGRRGGGQSWATYRDDKFGPAFDRAAQGVGAKVIRTAVRASSMNATAERFVGSARREVLDQMLLVDDQHLVCLLRQYQSYFNEVARTKGSANAYQRIV